MEQFKKYEELQQLLLSMKGEEDINNIKKFIDDNDLLKNNKRTLSTMKLISSVIYARPKLLDNAVNLIKMFDKIELDNIRVQEYISDNDVIDRAIIIPIILNLSGKKNSRMEKIFYNHSFFINPIKYWCQSYYINFGNNDYEDIKNMTDDEKIRCRNQMHSIHPIVQAILKDDVDKLQQLISLNNFDINKKIPSSYFEHYSILRNVPPLFYSASLGSVNCFKFLLNKTNDIDYEMLLKHAIVGGNNEIIHIIENESHSNLEYENVLLYNAILYMNNELIEYLIHNYDIKIDGEAYIKCIYSSNYEAMLKLIELDDSNAINEHGDIGSSPLDIAAFEGYLDFLKFLLQNEKVDSHNLNSYGKTMLQSAARNDQLDIVKYILKHKLLEPDDVGEYGISAVEIAENYGNNDIVSYIESIGSENDDKHEDEREEDY